MYSVALPQGAWAGMPCVIVVLPDHIHLFLGSRRSAKLTDTPSKCKIGYGCIGCLGHSFKYQSKRCQSTGN